MVSVRSVLLAFAILLGLTTPVMAEYADIAVTVSSAGSVTITGTTDSVELAPGTYNTFTSKDKEYWLLNLSTDATLDSFVYVISLPAGAEINYLSGKNARITTRDSVVRVQGSGSNAPLAVVVQYRIVPLETAQSAVPWIALGALILGIGIGIALWRRETTLEAEEQGAPEPPEAVPTYTEGLPARQQDIILLLNKAGGTLTQRQIEQALKLPKSSVSRNISALRARGIVAQARSGMSNTVVLEDKYR